MAIRDPERYFDSRTIKRHLKRGHASEAEYRAYLLALPDVTDNIKANDEGGDDDGFENRGKRGQVSSEPRPLLGLRVTMPTRVFHDDDEDDDDDDDYDDDDDDDDDDDVVASAVVASAVVASAPVIASPSPSDAMRTAQSEVETIDDSGALSAIDDPEA
jgi:hypothetical protein